MNRRPNYLLEVLVLVLLVLLIVSDEPLVLLCLRDRWVLLVPLIVSVLPVWLLVDVFCAKTAVTGSSERPRAAIMIFFILGISPYLL